MKKKKGAEAPYGGLKLNYKRTFIIGFAFFGILLLWEVYASWCPTMLTELFMKTFSMEDANEVQYLVGSVMALNNLAALIVLPIFGYLSDKTHTRIGKRMPYILVGTFVSALAFPLIPVAVHYSNLAGTLALMAIVIFFMMMYRNPLMALMPDTTPKPLRSKAHGIINIIGYFGGAFATITGIIFVLSDYYLSSSDPNANWMSGNIWTIEIPFLIASVLMVVSALVLFFSIKENEVAIEMEEDMKRGEMYAEVEEKILEGDKPLSKKNRIVLFTILGAEFLYFMAENGVRTFMVNYTRYYLDVASSSQMVSTILMGMGSVIGFAIAGNIAMKMGRKWTVILGLGLASFSLILWVILSYAFSWRGSGTYPIMLYFIYFLKGFGMSLVHTNCYPMVVELASGSKVGRFTGYYYFSSMLAQTLTPIALGSLMLIPGIDWEFIPIYGAVITSISFIAFFFVKSKKVKVGEEKPLEEPSSED